MKSFSEPFSTINLKF